MINKRDIRFFGFARNASKMSDFGKQHIGAVITYKGSVLSVGWNMNRTSTKQMYYNQFRDLDGDYVEHKTHAEISALNRIKYMDIDFSKAAIYVYREHKNGIRGCSKPCPACMNAIKDIGIKNIYYCDEDSFVYQRVG